MKKQRSAESTIRTHQLESVPCVVIRLEIVPLLSTPNRVPNGVPTPPLSSVPPITAAEIASITANIDALKVDLKTKKTELKSIDKEIARIEAKKVKAETKAAESAKKAEAEDVLKKLLASGVSADDILAKLK